MPASAQPDPIERMKRRLPAAYEQLVETLLRLEAHYREMGDIEFTVEDGTALPAPDPHAASGRRPRP